jgi:hypothetical protein
MTKQQSKSQPRTVQTRTQQTQPSQTRTSQTRTSQTRTSQTQPRKSKRVSLDTVRQLALALPLVEEGLSNGSLAFRVKGKPVAQLSRDGESLLIRIDYLRRDILINAEPETFYVTDFYQCHPMMFVRLSGIDREAARDLIEQSWRLQAPKRLAAAYEDQKSA